MGDDKLTVVDWFVIAGALMLLHMTCSNVAAFVLGEPQLVVSDDVGDALFLAPALVGAGFLEFIGLMALSMIVLAVVDRVNTGYRLSIRAFAWTARLFTKLKNYLQRD